MNISRFLLGPYICIYLTYIVGSNTEISRDLSKEVNRDFILAVVDLYIKINLKLRFKWKEILEFHNLAFVFTV